MMTSIISGVIMDGFRTTIRWCSIIRTGRPPTDMVMTTITTIIRPQFDSPKFDKARLGACRGSSY
ncbi:MAG: hypothetical protein ACXWM1_09445, partial [Candidatus Binataceae bacterium]